MSRYRVDFLAGVASGVTAGSTTISGYWQYPAGTPIVVPSGSYIPVIFNPGYFGIVSTSEIAYVTAVNAGGTVATVVRAQEGTTAITGSVIPWVSGPTAYDFDVTNLTSTGTLTVNNGITLNGTTGLQVNAASGVTIGGTAATGNLVITHAGGFTNTLTTQSLSTSVTNTLPNQTGTLLNTYGGQTISNGLTVLGSLGVGGNFNVVGAISSVNGGITTSGLTVYGGSQLNGGVTINGGLANELTVYGGLQTTGQSTFSGVPFPLTTSTSGITATVSPASGTYTKIASLTLSSGTWLLHSQAFASNTGSTLITADFWMNTTSGVATSSLSSATTMLSAAAGGSDYSSVSMSTVSTFASATTVFFQCYCSAVGVVIQKNGASTAAPANSTSITAIRIG